MVHQRSYKRATRRVTAQVTLQIFQTFTLVGTKPLGKSTLRRFASLISVNIYNYTPPLRFQREPGAMWQVSTESLVTESYQNSGINLRMSTELHSTQSSSNLKSLEFHQSLTLLKVKTSWRSAPLATLTCTQRPQLYLWQLICRFLHTSRFTI